MSRTMPTECEHGTVIDWGDFGPYVDGCDLTHPDSDDCPNLADCPRCQELDSGGVSGQGEQ